MVLPRTPPHPKWWEVDIYVLGLQASIIVTSNKCHGALVQNPFSVSTAAHPTTCGYRRTYCTYIYIYTCWHMHANITLSIWANAGACPYYYSCIIRKKLLCCHSISIKITIRQRNITMENTPFSSMFLPLESDETSIQLGNFQPAPFDHRRAYNTYEAKTYIVIIIKMLGKSRVYIYI